MKVNFRFWIAVGLSATVGLFVGEYVMARGIKTHTAESAFWFAFTYYVIAGINFLLLEPKKNRRTP